MLFQIVIRSKIASMTSDNKNVMAVGIFLCRPADKIRQFYGVIDGKIIAGGECPVFCHDAVLSGISANTVVLVSFPFSGSFEQHSCRHIITGSIGCLTDTLGENKVMLLVAARYIHHQTVSVHLRLFWYR